MLDVSEPLRSVEAVGFALFPYHLGSGHQPPLRQPIVVSSTRTFSTVFGPPRFCEKMSAPGNGEQPDLAITAGELNAGAETHHLLLRTVSC